MSPFLDPNDPKYSDTPNVSLHPLEGEKNVRPVDFYDPLNPDGPDKDGNVRPYIDMLDPADPLSPLTTTERSAILDEWIRSGEWPPAGLDTPPRLYDAIRREVLASSPAPAGLDAEAAARALHAFCQSQEPIHSWRDHVFVRAATRPAEDAGERS